MWRSRATQMRIAALACIFVIGVVGHAGAGESKPKGQSSQAPAQQEASDLTSAVLPESVQAERAVARNPHDRVARIKAAEAYLADGADSPSRAETAHRHALAVLAEYPTDIDALLLAGQTSLLRGDNSAAARYYQAATAADPGNATAFLGLGDALTKLGDEAGATAAFARYRALMGMPPL